MNPVGLSQRTRRWMSIWQARARRKAAQAAARYRALHTLTSVQAEAVQAAASYGLGLARQRVQARRFQSVPPVEGLGLAHIDQLAQTAAQNYLAQSYDERIEQSVSRGEVVLMFREAFRKQLAGKGGTR